MSKKVANVVVRPRGRHDTEHRMIKRFMKKVKKERVLETFRDTLRYKKPSEERREKSKKRKRVLEKLRESEKERNS